MKKTFILVAVVVSISTQPIFAQDNTKEHQLITEYYKIKNALVVGNANDATTAAKAFLTTANGMNHNIIPEGNINALVKDASGISGTTDITKQRLYFANFSINMAAVAKAVRLTDKPVYYARCPMKKAYWLSNEKAIKNPYYGSAMLTCGEVTETIQ